MTAPSPARQGPLEPLRVLDLSTVLAGPTTAQLLADYGADVVKVEHPQVGDPFRGHGHQKAGTGLWWRVVSRNKRCVGLKLSVTEGADVLRRLAAGADVVVENFRPGTMERWGLGWEDLHHVNPRLVMTRVSGFGQQGPYSTRPGFGTLAEAMSGFAAITGPADGDPILPSNAMADSIAGIAAATATMMALWHRDRLGGSGEGQMIDVSLIEPILATMGPGPTWFDQLGVLQQRMGNRSLDQAPRNTYRTADGTWLAVSTAATPVADRVMRMIGRDDLADADWFALAAGRGEHGDEIDSAVAEWIAARTESEVVAAFERADAAIAPILDAEQLLSDPQVLALDMIPTVQDPDLGPLRMTGPMWRMSATPGAIRHPGRVAIGADTDEVLAEVGYGTPEIDALRALGVVA
ncbi:MAG: CoA transferase [Microthrixaceae bacterium]